MPPPSCGVGDTQPPLDGDDGNCIGDTKPHLQGGSAPSRGRGGLKKFQRFLRERQRSADCSRRTGENYEKTWGRFLK